jgi:hypothetical protein
MRCRYPWPLKVVRFVESSLSFNLLTISPADIPCIIEDGAGGASRSTQPVTLYITVNVTPPNPYNSRSGIPMEDDKSSAAEATIQGRIQFPTPEHFSVLSPHQPVETGNIIPQSLEEVSPTGTENPRLALDRADEAMNRIVPIDGSNTWEGAIGRIEWVMDTLGPVAEVRIIPF